MGVHIQKPEEGRTDALVHVGELESGDFFYTDPETGIFHAYRKQLNHIEDGVDSYEIVEFAKVASA